MKNIESEIKRIQKRSRKNYIIYFVVFLFSIIATLFSVYTNLQNKKIEEKLIETEIRLQQAQQEQIARKTEELNRALEDLKQEVSNSGSPGKGAEYKSKIVKADRIVNQLDSINNSKRGSNGLNIRFYTYNPIVKKSKSIESILSKLGFSVRVYPEWEQKPSFFANKPTVFYYSKTTRRKAIEIAENLNSRLDIKFDVAKGAGYGIAKSEVENTFILHYME